MAAGTTTTLGAIIKIFDDSAVYATFAATGGLWALEIPEKMTAFPIAAILQIEEVPAWNTENQVREDTGEFSIHVFHTSLADAETYAASIMALYEPSSALGAGNFPSLNVANSSVSWAERTNYHVRLSEFRSPDGKPVYEVIMPMKTYVGRAI